MNGVDLKHKRVAISKRMRFEVFKRDGFECQYCGATPPGALLECDHVTPVAGGGLTEMDNLVTACFNCNRGKSDVPLSSVPQSMADRAAEVLEREAQISGYQAVLKDRRMRVESNAQEVVNLFCELYDRTGVPQTDFTSIKRFIEKLGLDDCLSSVERSHQKQPRQYQWAFKYFCGVCWGKIKDRPL